MNLPAGQVLGLQSDGSVDIWDRATGVAVGEFHRPWARDSQSNALPTRYAVDGKTIVQTITFSAGTVFPVAADPWWDNFENYGAPGGFMGNTNPNGSTRNAEISEQDCVGARGRLDEPLPSPDLNAQQIKYMFKLSLMSGGYVVAREVPLGSELYGAPNTCFVDAFGNYIATDSNPPFESDQEIVDAIACTTLLFAKLNPTQPRWSKADFPTIMTNRSINGEDARDHLWAALATRKLAYRDLTNLNIQIAMFECGWGLPPQWRVDDAPIYK